MATRSKIGIKNPDGTFTSVYCHWDGYPSHQLPILTKNYNTVEKVNALLEHGDMSSLDESCEKPEGHSFDTVVKGYTVYYGRDRGEENTEKNTSLTDGPLFAEEYGYLFDNGQWNVWLGGTNHEWIPSKDVDLEKD